eukprot:m.216543 g.216543  ORF g.216543 m.216543 type:complete len:398 (+) comp39871_c0_seq3:1214-2407(+)
MFRSSKDQDHGPILVADLQFQPSVKINVTIEGYVKLLWTISEEIFLQVTDTEYRFWLRANLFLFNVLLKVHASYGSLKDAGFGVYGLIQNDVDKIEKKVDELITNVATSIVNKIDAAQNKIKWAQEKLDAANKYLEDAKGKVDSLCSISRCSSFCVGCPSWDSCCTHWWGCCIGCPSWSDCCLHITNILCEIKNAVCYVLRGIAYAALDVAEAAVDVANGLLSAANAALKIVKKAIQFGAEAAEWVLHAVLHDIIYIKKIEFNVSLSEAHGGHFDGELDVSFFGQPTNSLTFHIDLNNILAMAEDLVENFLIGDLKKRGKRDVGKKSMKTLKPVARLRPSTRFQQRLFKLRRDADSEFDGIIKRLNGAHGSLIRSGTSNLPQTSVLGWKRLSKTFQM